MMSNLRGKTGRIVARFEAGVAIGQVPALVLEHGESHLLLMTRDQRIGEMSIPLENCADRRMPYFVEDASVDMGPLGKALASREPQRQQEPAKAPKKEGGSNKK